MSIKHIEVGVCGLSCKLCPMYHTQAASRCYGCKSSGRMAVGCPFITCAVKNKKIEFCWQCSGKDACEKWKKHREAGKQHDSFKCYQKLETDIKEIERNGIEEFEKQQKLREDCLKLMLVEYNEGRSKSYYCIAVTVLSLKELLETMKKAKEQSEGFQLDEKSKVMHSILEQIAQNKGYYLKLRK